MKRNTTTQLTTKDITTKTTTTPTKPTPGIQQQNYRQGYDKTTTTRDTKTKPHKLLLYNILNKKGLCCKPRQRALI